MRARTFLVHVCFSDCSILEANIHILLHFRNRIHLQLHQILNENPLFRTFLQLHFCLDVLTQKIMYFFIVNFDKAAANEVSLRCVVLRNSDDLAKRPRNYTPGLFTISSAHHRMRLSTSCLAIGKNGSIVPIKNIFD